MNNKLEMLKEWGCDVDYGVSRCVDDEELYLELLETFVSDENVEILGEKIAEKDTDGAFGAAHTLKGVAANLELKPVLDSVVIMVEKLRAGSMEGVEKDYSDFVQVFEKFREIMA